MSAIVMPFLYIRVPLITSIKSCDAGQDAPPTGLVLHGFSFNPTVVRLHRVELTRCAAYESRLRLHNWKGITIDQS